MTQVYTFTCIDEENNVRTEVSFETENDCWGGHDGPMCKFFDFLKGCGFVFDLNTEIGIMRENGTFEPAAVDNDF